MVEGVVVVKDWLVDKIVMVGYIIWCEDVCCWYFGQDWIFELVGMGVFDFGINVLFILMDILLELVFVWVVDFEVLLNC